MSHFALPRIAQITADVRKLASFYATHRPSLTEFAIFAADRKFLLANQALAKRFGFVIERDSVVMYSTFTLRGDAKVSENA